MIKRFCDICGVEVKDASILGASPRGLVCNFEGTHPAATAKYVFVQDSHDYNSVVDRSFVACMCHECYTDMIKNLTKEKDE